MIIAGLDFTSEKHDYFKLHKEIRTVPALHLSRSGTTRRDTKYSKGTFSYFVELQMTPRFVWSLNSSAFYSTNLIIFLLEQDYKLIMINPVFTNITRKASRVHPAKTGSLDEQNICKYMIDIFDEFSPYALSLYLLS